MMSIRELKIAAVIILTFLLVCLGIWSWGHAKAGLAAAALQQAARAEGAAQAFDQAAAKAKAEKAAIAQENQALKDRLQAHLASRPTVPLGPGPAPVVEAVLASDLEAMGLPGATVREAPATIFTPADAKLVWTWGKNALRVPALEQRIAADGVVIEDYGKLTTGLQAEVDKGNTVIAAMGSADEERKKQLAALSETIKAKDSQMKAQVWKGNVKIVITAVIFEEIGRRLFSRK